MNILLYNSGIRDLSGRYNLPNAAMVRRVDGAAVPETSLADFLRDATWFDICQPGDVVWTPVTGNVWTARIAGTFLVRGFAQAEGRDVSVGPLTVWVRFPSEEEMIADPLVAARATNLWAQTLALCTETNRHEVGCWIRLDTSTDTYCFTATTNGPPTPNNAVSSIDLRPLEPDSPTLPTLQEQTAVYTVASLHTHTPATYATEPTRPIGPSSADESASRQLKLPGLVCDYDASLPPDHDAPNGRIPTGHPTNANWSVFPTGVQPRRGYPWNFLQ